MDSLLGIIGSISFCFLFAAAAISKVRDLSGFRNILSAYQLLPAVFTGSAAAIIILTEILLAALWTVPHYRVLASYASIFVLVAYALAITVNLLRSRNYISCGCGEDQPISWWLVVRNGVYAAFAGVVSTIEIGRFDWSGPEVLIIVVSLTTIFFLERITATLLANASHLSDWRR